MIELISDDAPTMPTETIVDLKRWLNELMRCGKNGEPVKLSRAIDMISKNFEVQAHEVAILGLTADERSLRFLAPDNLRTVGQIPLSSTKALAARTARDKRPEIVNHFSVVPHASVFEAVPIDERQRAEAIQKIMSSPIVSGNQLIGVLQVSRKGKTATDAGPDFTYPQLRELKTIADALAPYILLCNKE
jgi:GAF domain-containing protein